MKRLSSNIARKSPHAIDVGIVPLASGRFLVRATCLSIRLSHRSLAIQPAPLVNKPPAIMSEISLIEGGALGVNHSDHPAGINKMSLPLGLFHRSNKAHCSNCLKMVLFFKVISILERLGCTLHIEGHDVRV